MRALFLAGLACLAAGAVWADSGLPDTLIPRGQGSMSYAGRTPGSVTIPGGLGLLSVGNAQLQPITGVTDSLGNQPQAGDACIVQLAPGSALPTSVTLSCSYTAAGQAQIIASSTATLTALTTTSPSVNLFWEH